MKLRTFDVTLLDGGTQRIRALYFGIGEQGDLGVLRFYEGDEENEEPMTDDVVIAVFADKMWRSVVTVVES
jgi:hypothetical protein